jgi:neutral trehalase
MKIQNYINGEFVNPIQGKYLDNYNPAIGEVYGQIPNSTKEVIFSFSQMPLHSSHRKRMKVLV